MNLDAIHFMREVLVKDYKGKEIPTMQVSYANTSSLHPVYKEAAFYDADAVRTLYHELGGGRRAGARMGSTVILPHRSRWAQRQRITADQVQVLDSPKSPADAAELRAIEKDKAKIRNHLMRD